PFRGARLLRGGSRPLPRAGRAAGAGDRVREPGRASARARRSGRGAAPVRGELARIGNRRSPGAAESRARRPGPVGLRERAPAAACGQPGRAMRLAGAAAAIRLAVGAPAPASVRAQLELALAPARQVLGEATAAAAWARGEGLSFDEAVAYALAPDEAATPT